MHLNLKATFNRFIKNTQTWSLSWTNKYVVWNRFKIKTLGTWEDEGFFEKVELALGSLIHPIWP